MRKKEVLRMGAFLRLPLTRGSCSDYFIEQLSLGIVPYLTCQTCNRVHFDGSPTTNLSHRRLRDLRLKKAQDPERFVEHLEPFPWLELRTFFQKGYPQRAQTSFDCPCGFARYYEASIWDRCSEEEANRPHAKICWSPDGQQIEAVVEVILPDNHSVTRTFSARLVSVDCFWGDCRYRKFFLTDFSPPYKKLEIVEVGLDPEKATWCFEKEYLGKAGWDFAVRVHHRYSNLRLYAGWYGRRVWVGEEDIVLPPHGIADLLSEQESNVQKQILASVLAQQVPKPTRPRVPLSDEDMAISWINSEFRLEIDELVEELGSDNVL